MTYFTIRAAEGLLRSATRGNWALADAVLADVPAMAEGNPNYSREGTVADVTGRLNDIAAELTVRGLTNPAGTPYTAGHLRHLRAVAMAWPEAARYSEASMRTHEDSMGRGREALFALCAVARGENPDPPTIGGDQVAYDTWVDVCARVRDRVERGALYPVTGNDLNRLLRRQVNYPQTLPNSVTDMLAALATARRGVRNFAEMYAADSTILPQDQQSRDALGNALVRLIGHCRMLLTVVTATISDEELAVFLAEESQR